MTRLFAGALGTNQRPAATVPNVPEPWPQLLAAWRPDGLRPVQTRTLPSLLNGRQHLVIMAPTNSGKSLCAHAELLRSCLAGQRAVLIEPLRVIANEQTETLTTLMTQLAPILGRAPTVRLSTGEFRTTDEFLADPPPQDGEILVVTPERLDLLLRNPDYDDFIASIGSVVVDEAQLLIDERRGRTLEGLLTGLLVLAAEQQRIPPRVVLLSATLPEPPRIADWLGGAEIIITTDRYPSLSTWVHGVTDQKAADAVISAECREALTDPMASVLVFVYKTTDAQSLAKALAAELGQPVGFAHSQMPSAAKAAAIHTFSTGQQRVLVASSALAQGVNLPCTTVIVRDTHYPGSGPVPLHQLRQMCGRAGRGDQPGLALVLAQTIDQRGPAGLARELAAAAWPTFPQRPAWERRTDWAGLVDRVAAVMARYHERGADPAFLRAWCARSLRGNDLADQLPAILDWLDWWKLASTAHAEYDDGRWRLTLGGRTAAMHGLPLRMAGGVLQLWRDLLQVDPADRLLGAWSAFDHLLILELLADRAPSLRRDSADLNEGIQGWMEQQVSRHQSLLWREWLHRGDDRAEEILGSLGVTDRRERPLHGAEAQKLLRQALLRAIVFSERMRGAAAEQLTRQWRLTTFDGIEEDLRDHRIWLSHGLAQLADWPLLSWHCNHVLGVDEARKARIRQVLNQIRFQALTCCGSLSTCSSLGGLLPGLRRQGGKSHVGIGTLRKLEAAGVADLAGLLKMGVDELVALGVRRDLAVQIQVFCRAALR
jgi:superfamily II DNA/RNA helicase